MRRFNERSSVAVRSRRIQALQILRQLHREQPAARDAILGDLGLTVVDLEESMESLFQGAIDAGELEECGCCGHYHRPEFRGDCRNDDERFPA